MEAVEQLKQRCAASGYKAVDIEAVIIDYDNIPRTLDERTQDNEDEDTHLSLIHISEPTRPY